MFKTYTLGRSSRADKVIEDKSVSRIHMEVTLSDNGRLFCVDCGSSQGSFRIRNGKRAPLVQGYAREGDVLVLGRYELDVKGLLTTLGEENDKPAYSGNLYEPLSIKPRRNSDTGEVIRKTF